LNHALDKPAHVVDEHNLDFGLDLPASASAAPAVPLAKAEPKLAFDVPADLETISAPSLPDLNSMMFETPEEEAVAKAPAKPEKDELSLDEFFGKPTAATAASGPSTVAPEFDLSGIDLDLNAAGMPGSAASGGADDPLSALHMEMDTKLDLAIAYQEIGDKEGARELIDEVIKGGSDEQVSKANAMRAKLA